MANSLAETIKTNFLNCAICFELYRDPRALPCQHGFCRECLEQCVASTEDKQTLICPTCRGEIHISREEVKDLPVHFLVCSLKDTVDMEKQVQKPSPDTTCCNCDDSNSKAIVRCLDCKQYLCDKCHASHKSFKTMRKHKVVTIEDILSGKVNLSVEEEKMCTNHGQPYRYYCKDEKKAICQDCVILKICPTVHDRITIDEAAQNKSDELEDLVKTSDETLKKCQEAAKEIDVVGKELEIHYRIAKDAVANVEQEYINLVTKTVKKFGDEIDKVQEERIQELDKRKTTLQVTMKDIKKAKQDTAKVIKSMSKTCLISSHADLSIQLKKLSKSQPDTLNTALGYVKFEAAPVAMPAIGKVVKHGSTAQRWKLIEQFSTGDFENICGITINQDGDIGITSEENGVRVFSRSGETKCNFANFPDCSVMSIAVTTDNKYVVDGDQEMLIYDSQGNKDANIPLYDMQGESSNANSVAVDSTGKIIVGLSSNAISIHNADGSLISKFATHETPYRLATTSNGEIVCSFFDTKLVPLMDYSGGNVKIIQPPLEVTAWDTGYVCCRQGEIFVAIEGSGDPSGVYRYTSEGDYLGCVTTEVINPQGIALSKDGMELFIADWGDDRQVKIFQRQ